MLNPDKILTVEEKYDMRKRSRLTDIVRGYCVKSRYGTREAERGLVERDSSFENGIELVKCYNFFKYTQLFNEDTEIYEVLIGQEPVGIIEFFWYVEREPHLWIYKICYFLPSGQYPGWDEQKISELLTQSAKADHHRYRCMSEDEKKEWADRRNPILFRKHLSFDDDFIAGLWRKLGIPVTYEDLVLYRDTVVSNWDGYKTEQKEKIAKELAFYLLPQYCDNAVKEELLIAEELCCFVMCKYGLTVSETETMSQKILRLKECFLINTLEKAKKYFIANECSTERYKDCCVEVDFPEIMDSFEEWDIAPYKKEWEQEALDCAFRIQKGSAEWNLERILDLLENGKGDTDTFSRLQRYIEEHHEEIYVRNVLIYHMQELKKQYLYDETIQRQLSECCSMLLGFVDRELTKEETEIFKRVRNANRFAGYCGIHEGKKIVVFRGGTRLEWWESWNREAPRYEPDNNDENPFVYQFWDESGLIGTVEAAEHRIIWNVISEDKERIFHIFTQYMRQMEKCNPDEEIRYATEEEAARWDEVAQRAVCDQKNFFSVSGWWMYTGKHLNHVLMSAIISQLIAENEEQHPKLYMNCAENITEDLIFYVLPEIERNKDLCTQEDLAVIAEHLYRATEHLGRRNEYLKRSSMLLNEGKLDLENLTAEMLLDLYRDIYLVNTV